MAKTKGNLDPETPTFEGAMTELEQLVRKLESGTQPLEQMLADYASAVELVQHCHTQLEAARRRIAQLEGVGPDGKPEVRDWDDTAPEGNETREPPARRRGR
jgi:exodeoxyribonuclease VII small subunit